jgi:hypothetical protein
MAVESIKKARKPLATGFLSGDELFFVFNERKFFEEFIIHSRLGEDLIDFAWFNLDTIRVAFNDLWGRYLALKTHKNEYSFVAMGLWGSIEKHLGLNSYFTMYLLTFIDFLMESRIDTRVLTYGSEVKRFIKEGYFVEVETEEMYDLDKREFIDIFLACISERQVVLERTLDLILEDTNSDGRDTTMARLYRLENKDKYFRKYWHSRFESYIGVVSDKTGQLAHLTALETIDDMMRYELVHMILQEVKPKRCKCCGKLFLPDGRSDKLYCPRIMPGRERQCDEMGANQVAEEKRKTHPELWVYRQAYERLYKRVEMGYMERLDFADWDVQARKKRDACHAGEVALDEFVRWIDETSRQRKA